MEVAADALVGDAGSVYEGATVREVMVGALVALSVIKALASHPLTDKGLEQFMADWAKTGQKIL